MIELHLQGGLEYMLPLTVLLIILIGLIAYVGYYLAIGKMISAKWLETIKHTGMLALAWGVLSTVIGLSFIFKSLQTLKVAPPLEVIMGGLQALLIALLYALIIFIISLAAYLLLKLKTKSIPQ
jgi:hypothetical protein